ncbi:MAG: nucleotidyltransferase domain-containing protein [Methanosphaera sp.]|nr:nucleotidyltransferase domain-containing protein [Methanosphaera sp.]
MINRINLAKQFAEKLKSEDIALIMLYGSVARRQDTPNSDIDILIVSKNADKLRSKVNELAVDVILDCGEVISPHLMTEEHFNKTKNNMFLSNVLKEGVVLG